MPLSLIPASDAIAELSSDEDFAALSETQQLKILDSVAGETARIYYNNSREDYITSNLAQALPAQAQFPQMRADTVVATIAGTTVTFSSALNAALDVNNVAQYSLSFDNNSVSYKHPTSGADSRTNDGFIAYSVVDGVETTWIAAEPL